MRIRTEVVNKALHKNETDLWLAVYADGEYLGNMPMGTPMHLISLQAIRWKADNDAIRKDAERIEKAGLAPGIKL